MKSVHLFAAAAAICLAASGAQASTLISSTTTLPLDMFSAPTSQTGGTLVGVKGSVGGQYASPFSDDTSPYNAVQSGNAEYDFGGLFNRLSFVFGSPDGYNSISFLRNGGTVDTFTTAGTSLSSLDNYFLTIGTTQRFDAVQFSSTSAALEFSNVSVSAVPLPASAPMFGAAVLALGLVGFGVKRKKAAAAA